MRVGGGVAYVADGTKAIEACKFKRSKQACLRDNGVAFLTLFLYIKPPHQHFFFSI